MTIASVTGFPPRRHLSLHAEALLEDDLGRRLGLARADRDRGGGRPGAGHEVAGVGPKRDDALGHAGQLERAAGGRARGGPEVLALGADGDAREKVLGQSRDDAADERARGENQLHLLGVVARHHGLGRSARLVPQRGPQAVAPGIEPLEAEAPALVAEGALLAPAHHAGARPEAGVPGRRERDLGAGHGTATGEDGAPDRAAPAEADVRRGGRLLELDARRRLAPVRVRRGHRPRAGGEAGDLVAALGVRRRLVVASLSAHADHAMRGPPPESSARTVASRMGRPPRDSSTLPVITPPFERRTSTPSVASPSPTETADALPAW